jgi:hypothetical protein
MFILLNLKLYVVFLAGEDLRQMRHGPILGFSTDKSTLLSLLKSIALKCVGPCFCYIKIGIEH